MSRSATPSLARRPLNSSLNVNTGSASSRSQTPLSNKPVISLEEWESKAPLTDEQLQSIALVKEAYGSRPLPQKFTSPATPAVIPASSSRPSTPIAHPRARHLPVHLLPGSPSSIPPSSPASPSLLASSQILAPPNPLHPALLTTPQQFHDHFTALTLSTEHEQDSLYRDHLAEIVGLREKCDGLIDLLKDGEGEVGEMLSCLAYVEERSESLRGACEDLLEEQTHLLTHTSHLAHRLTFFTFLETSLRMLNNPGNNLVLNPDFLPMVARLDECLGYLGEHRDFKDSELYLIRYQQCMTRSMTLIKLHFVAAIRALGQEVAKRVADRSMSETAAQALIYTKFVSLSQNLRPLLAELEHRVQTNPDDLTSLLTECHTAWVSTRASLMGSRVAEEIGRMEPARSDLVDLTRSGCSYLKQTCLDEFTLFKHFFLSGETQLYGFLETLCDYLYDHLRPRILHEPSLSVLCQVCTVLQALMVQDVSMEPDDDADTAIYTPGSTPGYSNYGGDDYFGQTPRGSMSRRPSSRPGSFMIRRDSARTARKLRKPLGRLHTEILLKMVLQDAQTRLVFRAQALIQADVQYYTPKDGDLDYPAKLNHTKGKPLIQRTVSVSLDEEDDDEPTFLALPPPSAQESWYPSLRVTLWVLSCLYTYIDSDVFEDLAQEAVTTCRVSLTAASDVLAAQGKDMTIDGKLFLVRHLLILKEMTAGLELGRRDRVKEWAGITDFLRSLLENATSILGYGRGSIVKGSDLTVDAKGDVDRELKRVCESLITLSSQLATVPLRSFLDRCTTYLSSKSSTALDLGSQEFSTPQKVLAVHDEFKQTAVVEIKAFKQRLMDYLQDVETVNVLLPPTVNEITDKYRQFHDLIRAEYDFTTAAAIMTPTALASLLTDEIAERR
ncbi:conserved oligomeric Golgi complex subunit 3, partial [Tremellales sp. Uapishka_1]